MLRPANAQPTLRIAPVRKRRDSKREDLLRVARDEFALNGYLGTHIAVVAGRVGIRKSTFFHYYVDKESLYAAAVGALLDDVADAVDATCAGTQAFDARIDAIVECLHRNVASEPSLPRLMLRGLVDVSPVEAQRPTALDRIGTCLVEAVQLGVEEGRVATGAAHIAPSVLAVVCLHDYAAHPLQLPMAEPLIGRTPEMKRADVQERVRRVLGVRDRSDAVALSH